jgi:hypothetical protein
VQAKAIPLDFCDDSDAALAARSQQHIPNSDRLIATPAQVEAISKRGGWYEAGAPRLEDMKTGAWFAGPPEDLVTYPKELEARYPGMEDINLSTPMGTPVAVMLDQFKWVSEALLPAFKRG